MVRGGDVLHLCFVVTKGVGVPLCLLRELGEQAVAQLGGVVHGNMVFEKCQQRILKTKDTGSLKDMVEEEEEETKDTEDYCE